MMKVITLTLLALLLLLEIFQGVLGLKCYECGDDSCPPEKDDLEQFLSESCVFLGDPKEANDDADQLQRCGRELKNTTECGLVNPSRKIKKCVTTPVDNCFCVVETCDDIEVGKGAGREGSAEGNSTSSSSLVTFDIIFAGYTFIIQFIHFSFQVATHN